MPTAPKIARARRTSAAPNHDHDDPMIDEPDTLDDADPNELEESPHHRRTIWGDMSELSESAGEHGILIRLTARWVFNGDGDRVREIIHGHRRKRAAITAGLKTVPVIMVHMSDTHVIEAQAIENLGREDLHPLDECGYYSDLIERFYDVPLLAQRFKKSIQYVRERLLLQKLPKAVVELYAAGKISHETIGLVVRLPVVTQLTELAQSIAAGRIHDDPDTVRAWIRRHALVALNDVPWDVRNASAPGGACTVCPKNTSAQRDLFAPIADKGLCADTKCWGGKMDWAFQKIIDAPGTKLTVGTQKAADLFTETGNSRPLLVRSSGFLDAEVDSGAVPGKTWLEAAIAADVADVNSLLVLVRDQEGRPRYLLPDTIAAKVRKTVREEPESEAAKSEAAADPAREEARKIATQRSKAQAALLAAIKEESGLSIDNVFRLVSEAAAPSVVKAVASAFEIGPDDITDGTEIGRKSGLLRLTVALLVAEAGLDTEAVRALAKDLSVRLPAKAG